MIYFLKLWLLVVVRLCSFFFVFLVTLFFSMEGELWHNGEVVVF